MARAQLGTEGGVGGVSPFPRFCAWLYHGATGGKATSPRGRPVGKTGTLASGVGRREAQEDAVGKAERALDLQRSVL